VEASVGLAHALDVRALAIGVETEQQVRLLRELGCDAAQGGRFGPPLAASGARAAMVRSVED
jgi:EAL domain-containing protein (putative c-di-GMP-specific phosphodiesterase class I)